MSQAKTSLFRPSALSAVADEIWKKSAGSAAAHSTANDQVANPTGANVFSRSSLFGGSSNEDSQKPMSNNSKPAESSGFVFGQNIKERAVVSTKENDESSPETETLSTNSANHVPTSFAEAGTANTGTAIKTSSNTNGSVSLFHDKLNAIRPDQPSGSAVGGRSALSGDPIKVITGEESETNVLHATCKLYVFDKDKEIWAERGRGMLHVNDKGSFRSKDFASRVVMRAQGSLRVILNSKIWSGAVLERASEKSFRLSANDFETGGITAYLITANAKDSQEIEECIRNRILRAKELEEEQEASRAATAASSTGTAAASTPGRKRKGPELVPEDPVAPGRAAGSDQEVPPDPAEVDLTPKRSKKP